ncbi:transcriptional regulator [Bacillus sp. AFS076308]|uniref:DegT/DnrJ/EryC1/StrS family aminotransferase n=1 Tax=unclassified Bacillus (in: firmicutes) TaxID=185979 RepID=UPI000BF5A64F|nr:MULTISPECIES: DegT/DnrJ/EryC1/StrS family aminotransferase [unclassified Bacillus (in: firmicutes)]PFO08694.1 transcriptional regulator [Bacillus sp. AFS076308]PGV49881.1 transcriptional regulator [Bacillus sp. AFS037270]
MISLVDLKTEYQVLKDEINHAIEEVLESGSFILGKKGKKLEQSISKYIGVAHGLGVANGTDALLLCLEALGIGAGDEVITTTFTFFATAEVIARVGATPVLVDIDPLSYNMNPALIESAITEKTKAIIVVHLFGKPANMDAIMEISRKYHLRVIEDACQSIGASFQGKKVGSYGDMGCFSFFPSKNLGAYGDGGMIVTNESDLFEKIKLLRNHGSSERYIHTHIGLNSRLDEIQAAVLDVKFKRLDEWNNRRRELAKRYSEKLTGAVSVPIVGEEAEHVFHQYSIESPRRDELAQFLNGRHIASSVYYPVPLHLQQAFQYLGYKTGDLPVSERCSKRILALPMNPMMTEKQQDQVIMAINEFFGEKL